MRDSITRRWRDIGRGAALAGGGYLGLVLLYLCIASFVTILALGLGLLLIPLVMVLVRMLADGYRRAAGRWTGVAVPSPYLPRPESLPSWPRNQLRLTRWIATDPATWRDLAWLPLNFLIGVPLAGLAPVVVLYGLYGTLLPLSWPLIDQHVDAEARFLFIPVTSMADAFRSCLLGLLVVGMGLWLAPRPLSLHARLTKALLGSTRSQLEQRLVRVTESRTEAADTSAADLRRIERDLHDGVQVRLLALGMNLTAIQRLMREDPEAAERLLLETKANSGKALTELRDLVRGIHPPVLADRGLADAVRAFALDLPMRAEVDIDLPGRAPGPIESAVYFAISESLSNVIKHAKATQVWVRIRYERGMLQVEVTDDGIGGADVTLGSGLRGLERRMSVFDGIVAVSSPPGGPTIIILEVPCVLS